MKKFTLIASLLFSAFMAEAQCSFTSPPYASTQPGITNFRMANVNRNSANIEGNNALVITGQTMTLTIGQTYSLGITSTNDLVNGPPLTGAPQHLRVYVDFNKNTTFTDAGETAYSFDYITFTPTTAANATYTTAVAVTVPSTVTPGASKLRVTAKMGPVAGHTPPTPCNVPADPLGYHGEMEEYNVVFVTAASVKEANTTSFINSAVFPNPTTNNLNVSFGMTESNTVSVQLFDVTGKLVNTLMENQNLKADSYTFKYDLNTSPNGIYFVKISSGSYYTYHKVVKTN